jgi:hypothetical protein
MLRIGAWPPSTMEIGLAEMAEPAAWKTGKEPELAGAAPGAV